MRPCGDGKDGGKTFLSSSTSIRFALDFLFSILYVRKRMFLNG